MVVWYIIGKAFVVTVRDYRGCPVAKCRHYTLSAFFLSKARVELELCTEQLQTKWWGFNNFGVYRETLDFGGNLADSLISPHVTGWWDRFGLTNKLEFLVEKEIRNAGAPPRCLLGLYDNMLHVCSTTMAWFLLFGHMSEPHVKPVLQHELALSNCRNYINRHQAQKCKIHVIGLMELHFFPLCIIY